MTAGEPKLDVKSARSFTKMILHRLTKHKAQVVVVSCLLLGEVIAEVLKPWPLKFVIDYLTGLEGGEPQTRVSIPGFVDGSVGSFIIFTAVTILGFAAFDGIVSFFGAYRRRKLAADVGIELRREAFGHLQRLNLQYHHAQRSGELTTRVVNDTKNIENFIAGSFPDLVKVQVTFAAMIGIMFWLDWRLTLIAVVVVPPVLYVVMNWFVHAIKSRSRVQRSTEGSLTALTQEALQSIQVVKAFSREDFTDKLFDREASADRDARLHAVALEAKFTPTIKLMVQFGVVTVVTFGILRVRQGALSTGDLWIFLSYFRGVKGPLKDLGNGLRQLAQSQVRWERIHDVLVVESNIDDPDRLPAPVLQGRIDLAKVGFGYDGQHPVLHDASLSIKPGEKVAIVGETGAGKSTLVSLIAGLYEPTSGAIGLDEVDVSTLRPETVREQIGFVLQESILFATTLRENIAYGRLDATNEEIEDAAKQARIHDFISGLPNGYDTVVGERGTTVSGGQRQRIAIARAILRDAKILILDEPVTGLDPQTRDQVWQEITQLMEGRTTLLITHDMNMAKRMDRVYVLRSGRIHSARFRKDKRLGPVGVGADLANVRPLSSERVS